MPRTAEPVANREIQMMRFIVEYHAKHGYMPGMREMGRAIGVDSTSLVTYYLDRLERWGLITRAPRVARSIVITPKGKQELGIRA